MICPLPYAPTLALTFGDHKEDTRRHAKDGTSTGYVTWVSVVSGGRWDAKWSVSNPIFRLTFTPDKGLKRIICVATDEPPFRPHPMADPKAVLRLAQEVVAAAWSGR